MGQAEVGTEIKQAIGQELIGAGEGRSGPAHPHPSPHLTSDLGLVLWLCECRTAQSWKFYGSKVGGIWRLSSKKEKVEFRLGWGLPCSLP